MVVELVGPRAGLMAVSLDVVFFFLEVMENVTIVSYLLYKYKSISMYSGEQ